MSNLRFNGSSGSKPQTEARRYVYRIISTMLTSELGDREGWMFGGIDNEFDRRRLRKAIVAVRDEMKRKADR